MQDGTKAVWSIPYVSVAFFPSLKQNFIAYRSSKVSDYIFEIHQLWQSGFSRVYSNCCSSCWFEPEIIKISQSSHKMYSNNILNFQESMTILNACTKSLETYWRHHVPHLSREVKKKKKKKNYGTWRSLRYQLYLVNLRQFPKDLKRDRKTWKLEDKWKQFRQSITKIGQTTEKSPGDLLQPKLLGETTG